MKKFKEIFTDENMEMPNKYGIIRVQRINLDSSVEFEFDDESKEFLRDELAKLPHNAETIYEPTLKKLLIILFFWIDKNIVKTIGLEFL